MSANRLLVIVLAIDIIVILLGLSVGPKPLRNFNEGGFVTIFSALQLLVIAALAWKTFRVAKSSGAITSWRSSAFIWALIAAGFAFMTLDELAQIHEHAKKLIFWLFSIKKTVWTDQLDNAIIVAYMALGLAALIYYRHELIKYKKAIPLLCFGFLVAAAMMAFDGLGTFRSLTYLFPGWDKDTLHKLRDTLEVCEESCKVLAGGIFIGVFYQCLQIARSLYPPINKEK